MMEAARIFIGLALSISTIIISTQRWKWHPFFALILAAFIFGLCVGESFIEIVTALQSGFGSLLQQIGLVVAVGAVLGTIMERTGAMEILGLSITRLLKGKIRMAMLFVGIMVGIPVFCDSGFIILSKLIPTLAATSGTSAAVLSLTLSSGLYTAHTLIPPTPGPLTAAVNLGLGENLGLVIWIGLLFSIPVSLTSYWVCSRFGKNIMVDGNPEMVPRLLLPGWKSALPLVTPVLLIAIGSFSKLLSLPESVSTVLTILGIPLVALLIGLALAFLNINFQTQTDWPVWISEALKDAGLIILITGAGGAFGAVIKAGGIEKLIQTFSFSHSMGETGLLVFGFTVAAILKSAQGSTTSSMIITSSIVGPMTVGIGIASQLKLSLILMAIGGGAMTVSHANDSYFWVMSKFGGITHRDMLKSFTPITLLQGLTVLLTATLAMQCV